MHQAAESKDIAAFRVLDTSFHRTVLEASGNAYLSRLWLQIEPSLLFHHVISNARFEGDWDRVAGLHAELIDVLEGGDGEAAALRFREHVQGRALSGER